ncbi:type I-F CRISPR-associated endoribonuclease Cas6/Csy4 [Proteus terrae]|uniref:type I-F CRISPR-associated endoribonuclease Cas6/Csy4 n=1 Tax=Proteus terrae TaxID=1574161 RepID=UPI0028895706|nr:type I-F CRISPR-associated endoribonuclease Cas6/Csy4 [Proteus terrae]
MKYYQDIKLLPATEISLGFIWEKVYQQIHLMLVEHKLDTNVSEIGLSFPAYGDKTFPLGDRLRLFTETEISLSRLNVAKWLQQLSDYIRIEPVKPVPSNVGEYACFTRHNPKSQQRRLKQLERRTSYLAQKHGVDEDTMRAELLASIEQKSGESKLPYINVQSLSTSTEPQLRHKFMLFIQCNKSNSQLRNSNTFSCYGLSQKEKRKQTFVPWF